MVFKHKIDHLEHIERIGKGTFVNHYVLLTGSIPNLVETIADFVGNRMMELQFFDNYENTISAQTISEMTLVPLDYFDEESNSISKTSIERSMIIDLALSSLRKDCIQHWFKN